MAGSVNRPRAVLWDLKKRYPIVSRAEGIYLYDEQGKRYIDGSGGASCVTCIGHGVQEIIEAAEAQLRKVVFSPSHVFANQPVLELADLVAEMAPGSLNRTWFVNGGSEAVDNAVKLARQYQIERGNLSKYVVISRWQGFHGNTIGALGVGGHTFRRRRYLPMFEDSPHIPPAYCYRCYFAKTYPQCDLICARVLESAICQQGPENVAAFIAEPVVGATTGAVAPPDGYFQIIREICDRYDVLFIADEVITGFGRTGRNFGIEHWSVEPDIVATGKGMSAGYTPLGAVILKDKIIDLFEEKGANVIGGHTFALNPLSAAIGVAVLRYMKERKLVERSREMGAYLKAQLAPLASHPSVGEVRGIGMLAAIEFVRDKESKAPFPVETRIAHKVVDAALERGLVVYPCTGTVNGVAGDFILMAPPFVITREQVDDYVGMLDSALTAVEGSLP